MFRSPLLRLCILTALEAGAVVALYHARPPAMRSQVTGPEVGSCCMQSRETGPQGAPGALIPPRCIPMTEEMCGRAGASLWFGSDQVGCMRSAIESDCRSRLPAQCGNGWKEGMETCDDRNTASGDGCSSTCAVESGWKCISGGNDRFPSVCTSTAPRAGACVNGVMVTEYPTPTSEISNPGGIIAGPDGNLWFTESFGNKIGKITPGGAITEYPISTPNSSPGGIAAGPDGNIWFTEPFGNKMGRITPDGAIMEYLIQTPDSHPSVIVKGSDGNMWFMAYNVTRLGAKFWIGRITPDGEITEYELPTPYDIELHDIALGSDGNMWFTEGGIDARSGVRIQKIGKITPGGVITQYPIPTPDSTPYSIEAGPDGNLWFVIWTLEENPSARLGKITPGGVITQYHIPKPPFIEPGIAVGPDGNLLLFENVLGKGRIARITPDGAITEYFTTNYNTFYYKPLSSIAAGPDGNLWFTQGSPSVSDEGTWLTMRERREYPGDRIGKVTSCKQQTGPSCGNGASDVGESCDDGNKANLDGCSATCIVEIGWTCSGSPSRCARILWGPACSPLRSGAPAMNVLGQPNFTSRDPGVTQTGMANPSNVVYDDSSVGVLYTSDTRREGTRFFVADTFNNRVLVYYGAPITNGDGAIAVLGQFGFDTNTAATTRSGMNRPSGLAIDATGHLLFVADSGNSRVLVYDVDEISSGEPAVAVLGQPNFTSNTKATTRAGMNRPSGIAIGVYRAHRLFVSDSGNSRVLVYDFSDGITDGMNAIAVLGQPSFTSSTPATTRRGMNLPAGIAFYDTWDRLFVADSANARVLIYNAYDIENGENAVAVLGQPDFVSATRATTQAGMKKPLNVAYDSDDSRLFVADYDSSRILVFDVAMIKDGESAVAVLGQPDFTSSTPATTEAGMNLPAGVAFDATGDRLFVADNASHRVLAFCAAVGGAPVACGDSAVEGHEGCDDGTTGSGDGCSGTCAVESGWTCTGSPSRCTWTCGNGKLEGTEPCDDGNTANGDGCSSTCAVESGWTCAGDPIVCMRPPLPCGNGAVEEGEACDDQNTADTDGCSASCAVESGWMCTSAPSRCTKIPVCGNGAREVIGAFMEEIEGCDDGNTASGDGCSDACAVESGWTCSGAPSACSKSTACNVVEYPIPTQSSNTYSIAAGPDGNMWFAEISANKIGRITPDGTITEYLIQTPGSQPHGIAASPDGNMWFTENARNKIGKITPDGAITEEYTIPTLYSSPYSIAAGPDGNMWFVEISANKIGRITPDGAIAEYPIPTQDSSSQYIALGSDGNMWFTEWMGNKIGRITPSGAITEYPLPMPNSYTYGIAAGSDGNMWFTEADRNKIGRITPSGAITEYPTPTGSGPYSIAKGPDGNMWFTERDGNKIGRITTDGAITEYHIPTSDSGPRGIAADVDGNIWFTEVGANKIGKVTCQQAPPPPTGCEACGNCEAGFLNACDETECRDLGPCLFTSGWLGGSCRPDPAICEQLPPPPSPRAWQMKLTKTQRVVGGQRQDMSFDPAAKKPVLSVPVGGSVILEVHTQRAPSP